MVKKIEVNGANVECYGAMGPEENVIVVGTFRDGEGFEDIWTNDDECRTWPQVGAALAPWAARIGVAIDELSVA